jgi:hypothetical protein
MADRDDPTSGRRTGRGGCGRLPEGQQRACLIAPGAPQRLEPGCRSLPRAALGLVPSVVAIIAASACVPAATERDPVAA